MVQNMSQPKCHICGQPVPPDSPIFEGEVRTIFGATVQQAKRILGVSGSYIYNVIGGQRKCPRDWQAKIEKGLKKEKRK
jgi:hypothetical protein